MKKISKYLIPIFLSCFALSGSTSFALAMNVKNAQNASFNFAASSVSKKTITYYLPKVGTTSEFVSSSLEVDSGTNLYAALSSHTGNIDGYTFEAWHSSNAHFRNDDENNDKIINSTLVTENVTVYAKYVISNSLYFYDDGHVYLTSSPTDYYTINSQNVYVGDHIFSYSGVEGVEHNLLTTNGVYKLTKSETNWDIKRKIGLGLDTKASWWTDAGAYIHLYCESSSESTWISDTEVSTTAKYFDIDYRYNKFVATRSNSATGSWTFWNQTWDIYFTTSTSETKYSKDHYTIYVQNTKDGEKYQNTWW